MSKQSFRSIAACLLGAALCVSAAACGTSDDASSSGSETSAASPQAYDVSKIETDEEIAALLPETIRLFKIPRNIGKLPSLATLVRFFHR